MIIIMSTLVSIVAFIFLFLVYRIVAPEKIFLLEKTKDCFLYEMMMVSSCFIYLLLVIIFEEKTNKCENVKLFYSLINTIVLVMLIRLASKVSLRIIDYPELLLVKEKKIIYFFSIIANQVVLIALCLLYKEKELLQYISINFSILIGFYISLENIQKNNSLKDFFREIIDGLSMSYWKKLVYSTGVFYLFLFVIFIMVYYLPEEVQQDIFIGLLIGILATVVLFIILIKWKFTNKIISKFFVSKEEQTMVNNNNEEIKKKISDKIEIYEMDTEEGPGVWALFGKNKKEKWECLQVGQSDKIVKEIALDCNYLKNSITEFQRKKYINQFGKCVGEYICYPDTKLQMYYEIGQKYENLVFLIISREEDVMLRKQIEMFFAWETKAEYWRNGRPYKEEKEFVDDKAQTLSLADNIKNKDDILELIKNYKKQYSKS